MELTLEELNRLNPVERRQYLELILDLERRKSRNKIDEYYPDTGPLRRELYTKHLEFFEAGATYRERCAMCANGDTSDRHLSRLVDWAQIQEAGGVLGCWQNL